MTIARKLLYALIALPNGLCMSASSQEAKQDLYVIDVQTRSNASANTQKKLAPALALTKNIGGALRGLDKDGRLVIALSQQLAAKFRASNPQRELRTVTTDWKPVTQLKVSYSAADKLKEDELRSLGLKLVEDYSPGSFMTVEPVNQEIGKQLLKRLENHPKIRHVSALFTTKATLRETP